MPQIKIIDSLDQADASNLKQIVHLFAAVLEPLHDGKDESQIAVNELLPSIVITGLHPQHECAHLFGRQHWQL